MNPPCYVIIAPVRNEAAYLPAMIECIAAQTILPALCIIVDDGSKDETPAILEKAAQTYPWFLSVTRPDRGKRKAGSGVMEAFYAGYRILDPEPWETGANVNWRFLAKLDGDVTFAPDFMERCLARFSENPNLGIGGGLVVNEVNGELKAESTVDPAFHVRGATKIYRRECWQAICGLEKVTGWDTIDELKANMHGWRTETFTEIPILHHRPAGAAYGTWANWMKNGRANYASGYHPLFMFLKCLARLTEKPYGLASLALGLGYLRALITRDWRVSDPAYHRYFTDQQFRRLLHQPNLWNP